MTVYGIDPGQSGGLAGVRGPGDGWAIKMPATERDIVAAMREMGMTDGSFVLLEKVGAMPGQGVSSTFKFGQNYGLLRGILIALEVPFNEVSPQVWKRAVGAIHKKGRRATPTEKKNLDKQKAQQIFPKLRITHATADALLIAHYAHAIYGHKR